MNLPWQRRDVICGWSVLLALLCVACASPRPHASVAPIDDEPSADVALAERVAAMEVAMNALAPWAQQCWAMAAADDFRLHGRVVLEVAPDERGASSRIVRDTTNDAHLRACLVDVANQYTWPMPLWGEAVEVPFAFTAPRAQYVVDRAFVDEVTQAGVAVATVLDYNSTGQDAVSLLSVRIAPGASTKITSQPRQEWWVALTDAELIEGGQRLALKPLDVIAVPASQQRQLVATTASAEFLVLFRPGGREGVARGGALPGENIGAPSKRPPLTICKLTDGCGPMSLVALRAGQTLTGSGLDVFAVVDGTGVALLGDDKLPLTATATIVALPEIARTLTATTDMRLLRAHWETK